MFLSCGLKGVNSSRRTEIFLVFLSSLCSARIGRFELWIIMSIFLRAIMCNINNLMSKLSSSGHPLGIIQSLFHISLAN